MPARQIKMRSGRVVIISRTAYIQCNLHCERTLCPPDHWKISHRMHFEEIVQLGLIDNHTWAHKNIFDFQIMVFNAKLKLFLIIKLKLPI